VNRKDRAAAFAPALVLAAAVSSSQAVQHNAAIPLSKVPFAQDEDVKCLSSGLLSGDPEAGPSVFLLKAPPGCLVRWHSHTAKEQLMVVQGEVLTEMEGMAPTRLGAGGFGFMESRAKHQFSCASAGECLLFVTFDREYDIFWEAPGP
jgi:quercetin dioxygenase-like cupin family protein